MNKLSLFLDFFYNVEENNILSVFALVQCGIFRFFRRELQTVCLGSLFYIEIDIPVPNPVPLFPPSENHFFLAWRTRIRIQEFSQNADPDPITAATIVRNVRNNAFLT